MGFGGTQGGNGQGCLVWCGGALSQGKGSGVYLDLRVRQGQDKRESSMSPGVLASRSQEALCFEAEPTLVQL